MREYELMVVLPLEEDQRAEGKERLEAALAAVKAEIEKQDDMGDRDLAYEVQKRKRAHYILYTIKTAPETIKELDRVFKLNANLLKYLFVNIGG
jgi:small subunit ribosomal protein S6